MFEWAPGIPILDDMKGNEDEGYDEEKYEDDLVEEILEEIAEEEDMDEDVHEGFLISDESDSNNPDSDTEVESLISTTEVEIVNDDKSVTSIIEE